MRLYGTSVSDSIKKQVEATLRSPSAEGREIIIILPSIPPGAVFCLGERLEAYCNTRPPGPTSSVRLILKVAFALGKLWQESPTPQDREFFGQFITKGWYDSENHLTAFRNIPRDPTREAVLLTILIGYDRVTDQASLKDFFRLDHETLFKTELENSFASWIKTRLGLASIEPETEHVDFINVTLKAVVDESLADLVGISSFLDNLDLSTAQEGRDAMRIVVDNLDQFSLPRMAGLLLRKRTKKIRSYFSSAIDFFSYGMFLTKQGRKKAKERVDQYISYLRRTDTLDDVNPDDLGDYEVIGRQAQLSGVEALAGGLKNYIETKNDAERQHLVTVDYPYLYDQILGFKKRNGPSPPSKSARRLNGMPLEVVLRALWLTMYDFKRWAQEKGYVSGEVLTEIRIRGDRFRHDCEDDDEQTANRLLRQTIGGIDPYLQDKLSFSPDLQEGSERILSVKSTLCPSLGDGSLAYSRSPRSEPRLEFTVTVLAREEGVTRRFMWPLPKSHPCRNMASMFSWLYEDILPHMNPLPVFCVPFTEELSLAKDEEEVNRVIEQAISSGSRLVVDLLQAQGIDREDRVYKLLKRLAFEYAVFIKKAHEKGIFAALEGFQLLEKAFREAYRAFVGDPACTHSQLGPLLFKAFFMVGERSENPDSQWIWRAYEPSAIITPLHPALLEMLWHQHAYLCESFEVATRDALWDTNVRAFTERRWSDIADLARMQWPIYGILRNEELSLDTSVRSFDSIHLVGQNMVAEATLSTRLLLRYDASEEDDIPDEDLFQESRQSRLIQRALQDYQALYSYADDGIAIAAYCTGAIQPLIAGIDSYLRVLFHGRQNPRPYALSVTIFAESEDDTVVSKWVGAWRERWAGADVSTKYEYYNRCKISVAQRLIASEKDYALFKTLINQLNVDVTFLIDFIRAGASGNRFEGIEPYDLRGRFRTFPVLEKPCCSVTGGGMDLVRERIISNRQFVLGPLHSQVMARLKLPGHSSSDHDYVVMGRGDYGPWKDLIDMLHKRSTWAVCIDPSIDERLVGKENAAGERQREIIGFGSGVGAHGEYNYTVSTEFFTLSQVEKRIASHIASRLGPWEKEISTAMATSVIKESLRLAGLSLVRATGPSEYVRDFISYALLRKLLPRRKDSFCDEVISLDAFRHWFDSATDTKRPDVLRLKADIVDGLFHIEVQLFECKLARESEEYLEKAREQLQNGLNHLTKCFRPRNSAIEGKKDRPDQRYWWLQLQRLLASKGRVDHPQLRATINALEKLSDGFFSIEWKAAAVTFWTDSDQNDIRRVNEWEFLVGEQTLPVAVISTGRQFVRSLCLDGIVATLPLCDQTINYSTTLQKEGAPIEQSQDGPQGTASLEGADRPTDSEAGLPGMGRIEEEKTLPSTGVKLAGLPKRITLGHTPRGLREIFWEFGHPELANRHVLIFGASGMGKTYAIQALLCELGKAGQNSLIVDYTNGFHDNQLEPETKALLKPIQHIVRKNPVPINPFRQQEDFFGDVALPEDPSNTAQRVAGVFSEVYELGDQQKAALYSSIKLGIEQLGKGMTLSLLIDLLKGTSESNPSATTVISKIQPFVDMNPFGPEEVGSWDKFFTATDSHCHILQLAGFLKDASRLITEFSLIDLYWYYRGRGDKDTPRVIVLDEIQNLDHRIDSPLGKFLTEGRKFGLSLILATQTLSNLKKDEQDRLFQASHKLFFRPAETEMKSYAQILESVTNEKVDTWVQRLSALRKGECYSLGPSANSQDKLEMKAFHIKIDSLGSRLPKQ